jgi:hypothetical protein
LSSSRDADEVEDRIWSALSEGEKRLRTIEKRLAATQELIQTDVRMWTRQLSGVNDDCQRSLDNLVQRRIDRVEALSKELQERAEKSLGREREFVDLQARVIEAVSEMHTEQTIVRMNEQLRDEIESQLRSIRRRIDQLERSTDADEPGDGGRFDSEPDWIGRLESVSQDRNAVDGIRRMLQVLECLDRDDKTFMPGMRALAVQIGLAFYRCLSRADAKERALLVRAAERWSAEHHFLAYSFLCPDVGHGYDPECHSPIGDPRPSEGSRYEVRGVVCWGLRDRDNGSVREKARVHLGVA